MNYSLFTTTRNGLKKQDSFETVQELGAALAFAISVGSTITGYNTPEGGFTVVAAVGKAEEKQPENTPDPQAVLPPTLQTLEEIDQIIEEAEAPTKTEETPKAQTKKGWFK